MYWKLKLFIVYLPTWRNKKYWNVSWKQYYTNLTEEMTRPFNSWIHEWLCCFFFNKFNRKWCRATIFAHTTRCYVTKALCHIKVYCSLSHNATKAACHIRGFCSILQHVTKTSMSYLNISANCTFMPLRCEKWTFTQYRTAVLQESMMPRDAKNVWKSQRKLDYYRTLFMGSLTIGVLPWSNFIGLTCLVACCYSTITSRPRYPTVCKNSFFNIVNCTLSGKSAYFWLNTNFKTFPTFTNNFNTLGTNIVYMSEVGRLKDY